MSLNRYRNLWPDEAERLEARPDFEPYDDAFVDTLKGVVHFAAFDDDDSQPSGYSTRRWTRPLTVGGAS